MRLRDITNDQAGPPAAAAEERPPGGSTITLEAAEDFNRCMYMFYEDDHDDPLIAQRLAELLGHGLGSPAELEIGHTWL